MATPRILVAGSSNTDLVIECQRLPRPGETLLGGQFREAHGGKGANQAVAAARAGAQVVFVGATGDDAYGAAARKALEVEGIDLTHCHILPGVNSGVAMILLGGADRENLIAVSASANDQVSPEHILAAEAAIAGADVVLTQLEIPLDSVETLAGLAKKHHKPFILNPAPAQSLPDSLLRHVDILIPNEHEIRLLSGLDSIEEAAHSLLARGCRAVVVTLGSEGAHWFEKDHDYAIPAPKVVPVDTVGAGDCFCAWLSFGIAEGGERPTILTRAIRAASVAVTRRGCQSAMPLPKDLS